MPSAESFDRHALDIAFSEVELVRQALPRSTITALAEEVVQRVATQLSPVLPNDIQPDPGEVDALCEALLSEDPKAAAHLIESFRTRGARYDVLCLSYLAAASRHLGDYWNNDKVSFYRVTIAAGRVYAALRVLRLGRTTPAADLRRSAIFASVPGEQHTLGVTMATDLARDMGWDIELLLGLDHDDLVATLQQRRANLIALSAGAKRSLPALMKLIVALRISNPDAFLLVCGQIVSGPVPLVGMTGADGSARDFLSAMAQMEDWIRRQPAGFKA